MVDGQTCGWCGASLDGPLVGERLRRCERCGVLSTDPAPSVAELDQAYTGWYRPAGGRFSGPLEPLLRRLRGRLASRIDRIASPGPVLDIGSGEGWLLEALGRRGRDGQGSERNPGSDRLELPPRPPQGWAAIVLWHSLEHLREPGRLLAELPALLSADGVVVVAMPNPASVQARVFGPRWFALDLPRHLIHVPAPALLRALREAGLRPARTSGLRGGQSVFGWLQGMLGALPGSPDLYDAIRTPPAQRRRRGGPARAATLLGAALLLPVASGAAVAEAAIGRGGSIYVEARRV